MCLLIWNTCTYVCVHAKLLKLCPTVCGPMDCSSTGSCVCGILQTRILEWVICPPQGDLPNPGIKPSLLGFLHWLLGSLPLVPSGKPIYMYTYLYLYLLMCTNFKSSMSVQIRDIKEGLVGRGFYLHLELLLFP